MSEDELSLDARERMARDAFYAQIRPRTEAPIAVENDLWVKEVFEDHLIVEAAGALWLYPYTIEDAGYVFGEPEKVKVEYVPAKDALIFLGGAVKALGDGRVGGYLVRFTTEDEPDLEGEFFDSKTYYGDAMTSPVYYGHGLDGTLGLRTLGIGDLTHKDAGVWIEAQLEMRDEYERAVYALAEKDKLGWSSGTAPHLVEREEQEKAVHISRWPLGLDATLTPIPADPGNRAMPLKAWADAFKSLEVEPQAAGDAAVATTATEGVTVHVTINQTPEERAQTEVKKMAENEMPTPDETPSVDVKGMIAQAVEEATKAANAAWEKRLADMPAVNKDKAGVAVTGDEADRALEGKPFKMGEFLQTVAKSAGGMPVDKRMLPLFSRDSGSEGYYDMTGALGPEGAMKSIGSFAGRSIKAPTGMGELIPSAGGFLVGTDRDTSIMARAYNIGQLLQMVDFTGISAGSNGMTFLAEDETSRVDGSRRGGIRAYYASEASEKTASQLKWRELELKLYKLIGFVYATDELLADATALESEIMSKLPEELRFTAEDRLFWGTGAGMPMGFMNGGSLISVAAEVGQAAATVVAENVSNMWARRWLGGRNYVWLYNQDVEPQFDGMFYPAGTGGQLVYQPPGGLSATPYGTIKGRPALPVEYAETLGTLGDLVLVSLDEMKGIEKGGMESASSIHVRFAYDETCFRFVWRHDMQPKWDSALTPYKGTNTVSPFVALASRT